MATPPSNTIGAGGTPGSVSLTGSLTTSSGTLTAPGGWGTTLGTFSTNISDDALTVSALEQLIVERKAMYDEAVSMCAKYQHQYAKVVEEFQAYKEGISKTLEDVAAVYSIVTDGLIDYAEAHPDVVIAFFNDYVDDAIEKEKTDISSWKFESFQPGDTLVFKLVADITPEARKSLTQQISAFLKNAPGVSAIVIPGDVDFMDLKESEMNKIGWHKK